MKKGDLDLVSITSISTSNHTSLSGAWAINGFDKRDRHKDEDARDGEGTLTALKLIDNFVGGFAIAA